MAKKKKKIKRYPAIFREPVIVANEKKKIKRYPVSGPLIVSYKDPSDDPKGFNRAMHEVVNDRIKKVNKFLDEISTEVGWVETLTETPTISGFEPTRLYPYQKDHMNNHSKYRWMNKSRQVGASYGFSAEGLAKCHLMNYYTCIFVSLNQEEANEKINYSRAMYESVPLKYQRKMVIDRVTALEFEKRTGGRRHRTRLISHPQRAVRGKGGNVDVVLDEFAHYVWANKIYVAAVPVITRGLGQLTIGSSPLGRTGLHWQIGEDRKNYPMYSRQVVPWFRCLDFLNEEAKKNYDEVQKIAPKMQTEDRVWEFGNEAIVSAFASSLIEEFWQEYELRPYDERESYYPMDLIQACTFEYLLGQIEVDQEDIYGDSPKGSSPVYPGLKYRCYDSIESLAAGVRKNLVGRILFAGYDVGRYENASELMIIEEIRDFNDFQMVRHTSGNRGLDFESQQSLLDKTMSILPIRKMRIDTTGIGKQLGEYMKKRYRSRIDCVDFNIANKQDMAAEFKIRLEEQLIGFPFDKSLIKHIHSIRREISTANQVRFVAAEIGSDHGDKFWALALASSGGTPIKLLKTHFRIRTGAIPRTAKVIPIDTNRRFSKKSDEFVLPGGIEPPPIHGKIFSIGGLK